MKYLFIDRDGTLIVEPSDFQIDSLEKFQLLPNVISSLTKLKEFGFKLVMITNQDGLGTKKNPQDKFDMIQGLLLKILSSQGIDFDEVLVCPHFPEDKCRCRKPAVGLVKKYISSNDMDRENSFVIGDRDTDIELAENMGLKGFKISQALNWSEITHQIVNKPRTATITRQSKETSIEVSVDLDRAEKSNIKTELGFFDHMLDQIARNANIGLKVNACGDLHIDDHHLIEDVGIAMGQALKKALGDKIGIGRYGFWLPMDESDAKVTLDICNRFNFKFDAKIPSTHVGEINIEMIPHFFRSLAENMGISLHIEAKGENSHHIVEGIFKAFGRAVGLAVRREGHQLPSTKGIL